MADFPNPPWPPLNVITPYHSDSLGGLITPIAGTTATSMHTTSSAVFVDEQVYFYPFQIFQPATAVKMSYLVGATAAGTVDLGIYSQENLLVSTGLTAQGTVNVLQEFDITDTPLSPGTYYMAIKCTDGTGTSFSAAIGADEILLPNVPWYIQATGAGTALPNPATFALDTTATLVARLMGVHFDTLI